MRVIECSNRPFELTEAPIDLFKIEYFVPRRRGGCKRTIERAFLRIDDLLVDGLGNQLLVNVLYEFSCTISEVVPDGS